MTSTPNVLLIVVDCLRSDRLFSPARTCKMPQVDRLVARGASFANVFVENSITAPSFTSIFTGRYTANHGVIGQVAVKLDPRAATMAELFAANGYHTYAEVTGPLNPFLGLDRGFSQYRYRSQREYFFGDWGRQLLERLRHGAFQPPFFLAVHFWEAHVPRQVIPGFDSGEYGDTAYDRSLSGLDSFVGELVAAAGDQTAIVFTGDHGECVGERPGEETLLPYFLSKLGLPPLSAQDGGGAETSVDLMAESSRLHRFADQLFEIAGRGENRMGRKERLMMSLSLLMIGVARYRMQLRRGGAGPGPGSFANLKQKLDDLLLFLAVARGKPEAAQIQLVKTSLAEHNLQHGYHIYDYLQRVPAVFVREGLFPAGRRVTTEVRHIDLLPTLVEAFGLETSAGGFDGVSYWRELCDGGGRDRAVYLEARGGAQAEKVFLIRGVRRDNRKVAYAPFEPEAPVEFYDLAADPLEGSNLAPGEPGAAATLRAEAEAMAASFGNGAGEALSAAESLEMVKRLQDLGYM